MLIAKMPLLKQTVFYGASIALMKGISLLMLPYLAHHLAPEEFGRLETLTTLAVLASIICAAGLEDTLYKYVGFADTNAEKKQQAANIYGLSIALFVAVLLMLPLLSQLALRLLPGDIALFDIQLILAQVALEACIAVPLGWLRLTDKAAHFFVFAAGRALLQALLTIVLLHYIGGIRSILIAGLIAALLQALGLAYFQLKSAGVALDKTLLKPACIYALPVIGSGLVNFPLAGLDRWLIAAYSNEAALANVAIAAKFALAGVLLLQPFTMWWSPKRFTVLAGTDGLRNTLKYQLLGLLLLAYICLQVALGSPWLMTWLLPTQYHDACLILPYLLTVVLLKESCELINIGCFSGKSTTTQLWINLTAALFTGFTMWLSCEWLSFVVPHDATWLIKGVLASLILGQTLRCGLFYYFSQRAVPLPYSLPWLMLGAALTIAAIFLSPHLGSLLNRVSIILISSLLLALIVLFKQRHHFFSSSPVES